MSTRSAIAAVLIMLIAACEREERQFRELPASPPDLQAVRLTTLEPGLPLPAAPTQSPYDENALGVSEGKRLYSSFNCSGCHAMGGGGIGPALMDDKWIYGASPEQIYSTIVQGRPNGMPAFGSKVQPQQIWQLVAFVRSLSLESVPMDVRSGRDDDLSGRRPEVRMPRVPPRQTGHR